MNGLVELVETLLNYKKKKKKNFPASPAREDTLRECEKDPIQLIICFDVSVITVIHL